MSDDHFSLIQQDLLVDFCANVFNLIPDDKRLSSFLAIVDCLIHVIIMGNVIDEESACHYCIEFARRIVAYPRPLSFTYVIFYNRDYS